MPSLRILIALALSVAAVALSAGPASAAVTRVASPSSSRAMEPCATATPCRLDYAMLATAAGDDVSLLPGDYYDFGTTPWAGLPPLGPGTSIHGSPGSPAPVIHGQLVKTSSFLQLKGATALDLAVAVDVTGNTLTASALFLSSGAVAKRVQVHATSAATGSLVIACSMDDNTGLADSVCAGDGTGVVRGVSLGSTGSSTGTIRNVTAVSVATTGVGIDAGTFNGMSVLTATNVIARGTTADIRLTANSAAGVARLRIDHSNFRTPDSTGIGVHELQLGLGNQTESAAAAPLFVDAAAGDFRQAPGSPTIDAGATHPEDGPFDFAGEPRVMGPATDIGADEIFPPPVPITGPASGVGEHVATLSATVDPGGDPATVVFQYGRTAAYGSVAEAPAIPVGGPARASASLDGLSPDTTYHYRVVATTARGGTAAGADRTFRTAGAPDSGPGSGSGSGSGPAPTVSAVTIGRRWRLSSRRRTATSRRAPVGTTIRFRLSKAAKVTLEFSQPRRGRPNLRGRLAINGRSGANRIRFRGRLSSLRTLRPGAYVLTVRATDSGGRNSAPRRVRFTIVR